MTELQKAWLIRKALDDAFWRGMMLRQTGGNFTFWRNDSVSEFVTYEELQLCLATAALLGAPLNADP